MLNVNDSIILVSYDKLPKEYKDTFVANYCGKRGYIVKQFYRISEKKYYYRVKLEGYKSTINMLLTEDVFENSENISYAFEVAIDDTRSIIRMKDSTGNIVAEGQGRIIGGNRPQRIAQATYYAIKKLNESLGVRKKEHPNNRDPFNFTTAK